MPRPNNGPSLVQNSFGVYEIRYSEGRRSVRLSTRTKDIQEAQLVLAGYITEKLSQDEAKAKGAGMTIRDILQRYMTGHVDKLATAAERQGYAQRWLDEGLGKFTLERIDDKVIEAYCEKRRTGQIAGAQGRARKDGSKPQRRTGASDGTLRRELNMLVAAINYCRKHRLLKAEDVPHIALPPAAPPKDLWLTELEADQLLSVATREEHPDSRRLTRGARFVVLALATAARKSAILGLRWDQVDMTKWVIHYQAGELKPADKSGRNKQKSKKRRAAVPIAEWARPYVQRMHDEQVGVPLVLDHDSCIGSQFERIIKIAAVRYRNAKFLETTPHTLRHTAATLMLRAGTPLWEVAGVLGDSMETVSRVYGHHASDQLTTAVNSWKKTTTEETV